MTTIQTRATPQAREAAGDALFCEFCGERIAIYGGESFGRRPGEPVGFTRPIWAHFGCYEKECKRRGNHVHA